LIPSWAKDPKIGAKLINARAETVADKPAFRNAFRHRRCSIVADGFYEWQSLGQKSKQPYYFRLESQQPFAIAGLWENWISPESEEFSSCTILTTQANPPNCWKNYYLPRNRIRLKLIQSVLWLITSETIVQSYYLLCSYFTLTIDL
jgi:hypothetical protein